LTKVALNTITITLNYTYMYIQSISSLSFVVDMQVGDTKFVTGSLLLNYYATCIVHE
jgi:hypothetical protein